MAHHYRPKLKESFVSWLEQSRQVDYALEVKFYPLLPVTFIRLTTHYNWDYLYLWMLVLFLVLLGLYVDGTLNDIYVIDSTTLCIPLVLMILSQSIPVLGALIGVVYYNDLTKFLARAQIQFWVSITCRIVVGVMSLHWCIV